VSLALTVIGRSSKVLLTLPMSGHRRLSTQEAIPNLPSNLLSVETETTSLRNSGNTENKNTTKTPVVTVTASPLRSPSSSSPSASSSSSSDDSSDDEASDKDASASTIATETNEE
jgi:hypothetical protein